MTTDEPIQHYEVRILREVALTSEILQSVIDWKIENDVYYFFLDVPGQERPQIRTQWIKSPRLDSVVITPVGTPVPYPPRPDQPA